MKTYTTDEKIDYIFKELKSQKRNKLIKFFLKLIIIAIIIVFYFQFINGINKEELMDKFNGTILEIVKPITQDLLNDIAEQPINIEEIPEGLLEKIKSNPNILK